MTNFKDMFNALVNPGSTIKLYFDELHLSADYNPEYESQGELTMRCQGMAEIDQFLPAGKNYRRQAEGMVCPLYFSVNDSWPTFTVVERCIGVGVLEDHKMSIDLKVPTDTLKLLTELMIDYHKFTSRDSMIERFIKHHPNAPVPKYFLRVNFEPSKKQDPEGRLILLDIDYICTDP